MKLEASHYDTIEWNPKPLAPGTAFYKPQKIAKIKIGEKKENWKLGNWGQPPLFVL